MAKSGVEIRAAIDTENVRGLLLINGGAAVTLLAALPQVWEKPGFEYLTYAILVSLIVFQTGLVLAVVHNRLRRKCSLEYDRHNFRPPPGVLFGFHLSEPRVCILSIWCMWFALGAFVIGGVIVFFGGWMSLNQRAKIQKSANATRSSVTVSSGKIKPTTDEMLNSGFCHQRLEKGEKLSRENEAVESQQTLNTKIRENFEKLRTRIAEARRACSDATSTAEAYKACLRIREPSLFSDGKERDDCIIAKRSDC